MKKIIIVGIVVIIAGICLIFENKKTDKISQNIEQNHEIQWEIEAEYVYDANEVSY